MTIRIRFGCSQRESRHAGFGLLPAAAPARAAYTLLELLIVGVLVSVLMLGVWSLFRNWSGLYERGETRARRIQLVRSLCDQLSDDVRSVTRFASATATNPSGSPGVSTAPARAGSSPDGTSLMGGSTWMVLNVVQAVNPWHGADPGGDRLESASTAETRSELMAPELRRVIYTFTPPERDEFDSLSPRVAEMAADDDTELVADDTDVEQPTTGLLRLVLAHESSASWSDETAAAMSGGMRMGRTADTSLREIDALAAMGLGASDDRAAAATATAATGGQGSAQDTDREQGILERDEVPEVVWFALRYFDGTAWSESWNSQTQGSLPVAVELRFELEVTDPAERSAPASDGDTEWVESPIVGSERRELPTGSVSGTSSSLPDALMSRGGIADEDDEVTPYYRFVVLLGPAVPIADSRSGTGLTNGELE